MKGYIFSSTEVLNRREFGDYVFFTTEEIARKNNLNGLFLIQVEALIVTYCSPTCWRTESVRHIRPCEESRTA